MTLHDGLGSVVKDDRGHATEVTKGRHVARPERDEVLARHEAAERVTAVAERHVKAVDVDRPRGRVDHPLVAPVDLSLRTGQDLEAAVQLGTLGTDPRAGLGHVHLHALVAVTETVLGDETLVDDRPGEVRLTRQPLVDETGVGLDHPG